MAGDQAMIVAGIGCRRGTAAEAIEAVLALALGRLGWATDRLDAIATLAEKTQEEGLQTVAARLALPLIGVPRAELLEVADRIATVSAPAEAAHGVPSVAEASALAAAGADASLLVPRIATAGATCAIAEGKRR
jgi:cobalt-precorrin 5A hydrolase